MWQNKIFAGLFHYKTYVMAKIEIFLPAMGEGIIEATITRWLKNAGEPVKEDESLVEIATDKVDSEIPSPGNGVLSEILVKQGEVAKIGQMIAILSTETIAEQSENHSQMSIKETKLEEKNLQIRQLSMIQATKPHQHSNAISGKFLSPLVRQMIQSEGIDMQSIEKIQGSGLNGRITKNDVILLLAGKNEKTISLDQPAMTDPQINTVITPVAAHKTIADDQVEIVEMDRVRKLIAAHMVRSKQISPHVTSFAEANVSHIVEWRNRVKNSFEKREGFKLTYTPVFFEAVAKALIDFPRINVSVDNDNILIKKAIHIGMATALPDGNLIVPVVKDAAIKNFRGLARSINELAFKARAGKLSPDDIHGGTFTITNLGSAGTLAGTPIINQPEAAVLGIGSITKSPIVVETPQGDFVGIGYTVILSLSYDHRIIDGMLAGQFLNRIIYYLKNFDTSD